MDRDRVMTTDEAVGWKEFAERSPLAQLTIQDAWLMGHRMAMYQAIAKGPVGREPTKFQFGDGVRFKAPDGSRGIFLGQDRHDDSVVIWSNGIASRCHTSDLERIDV